MKASKLTARGLAYVLRVIGRKIAKHHRAKQTPRGKQSVKKLMAHGASASSIELSGDTKLFDRVARKWNVDYAFYKTGPDKYLLFFKAGQADAMTACFSEYSRKVRNKSKSRRIPIRDQLKRAAEHHYPTMSIDELCALPVADLAAPDSALFLWATFPQLPEALRLIREWGFTYKSVAFVWLKKNRKADSWFYGLGFWTRANAEVCLLATRGHPKRQAANIHQFIISPIEAHSKKPDETRDKIVALMGDLPRVELFARQTPPGWDVWGNEVQSTLRDFGTICPKEGG